MPDLYPLLRPLLFRLPAESANTISVGALRLGLGRIFTTRECGKPGSPLLQQRIWALDFPNPIGLAAGCDKDARAPGALLSLGFGFVEIGTVTPQPQPGNPKPRLFRLDQDRAAINRLGFNSGGLEAVVARLARRSPSGIVGVNLGKNRDSVDAAKDYEEGIRRAAPFADYIVINISSPNTQGLRDLHARARLDSLLRRLVDTRNRVLPAAPLLLKIAPDITRQERADIAEVSLATRIDGMIVSNTTIERPPGLRSRHAVENGGLSGRPLFRASTALLADMYRLTEGKLPLIGVGGISSAADAYAKICAGASLVQLYTALVYDGPALVSRIKTGLVELLDRDGYASIAQAVGSSRTRTE
jgi:dihydroorotate dehydrogenase